MPDRDRDKNLSFIENVVCQRHWKRDFDWNQKRMYPYGDDFSLKNRNCFFLIDHHGHDHAVQEGKVPVIWYKWMGESLQVGSFESSDLTLAQADKAPSVHMNEYLLLKIQ